MAAPTVGAPKGCGDGWAKQQEFPTPGPGRPEGGGPHVRRCLSGCPARGQGREERERGKVGVGGVSAPGTRQLPREGGTRASGRGLLWGLGSFTPGRGGGVTLLNLRVPGRSQDAQSLTGPKGRQGLDVRRPRPPTVPRDPALLRRLHGTPQWRHPTSRLLQGLCRASGCRRAGGVGERGWKAQPSPGQRPRKTPASLAGSCCRKGGKEGFSSVLQRGHGGSARWLTAQVGG